MGKSSKLFKTFVKSFKSPSKEKPGSEKSPSSRRESKDSSLRKGNKDKCLWSLGKSSSRSRDVVDTIPSPDSVHIKAVHMEDQHYKDVLPAVSSYNTTEVSHEVVHPLKAHEVHVSTDHGHGSPDVFESYSLQQQAEDSDREDREEWAAATIQAAFRCYLARRAYRALKALVKIQAIARGQIVRKQASASLRALHALVRIQAMARGSRVRRSELGLLVQKHLQQTKQQKRRTVTQSKQDAALKRQRALVRAYSEQLHRSTTNKKVARRSDFQPDRSYWAYVWLERWTLVYPWEGAQDDFADYQEVETETYRELSVVPEPAKQTESPERQVHSSNIVDDNVYYTKEESPRFTAQTTEDGTMEIESNEELQHHSWRQEIPPEENVKDLHISFEDVGMNAVEDYANTESSTAQQLSFESCVVAEKPSSYTVSSAVESDLTHQASEFTYPPVNSNATEVDSKSQLSDCQQTSFDADYGSSYSTDQQSLSMASISSIKDNYFKQPEYEAEPTSVSLNRDIVKHNTPQPGSPAVARHSPTASSSFSLAGSCSPQQSSSPTQALVEHTSSQKEDSFPPPLSIPGSAYDEFEQEMNILSINGHNRMAVSEGASATNGHNRMAVSEGASATYEYDDEEESDAVCTSELSPIQPTNDGIVHSDEARTDGVSDTYAGAKAEEPLNRNIDSPSSKQEKPQQVDHVSPSPSVPSYMAPTKSAKAKVRGPISNSPKQKPDSPKPKTDSPKPKQDSPKVKAADPPKPKSDAAVKRRHSMSSLEGRSNSTLSQRPPFNVRGSSKYTLPKDTSGGDHSPRVNGESRRHGRH